ncbi:MAG: hypothetical protein HY646_16380 [Acidobacteria bacterium]|nr:hypothetical protein [Acidobacteriota bacterium]
MAPAVAGLARVQALEQALVVALQVEAPEPELEAVEMAAVAAVVLMSGTVGKAVRRIVQRLCLKWTHIAKRREIF